MGISAINTSNNLLYLLTSLLLGFMGASGFLGKRNLSNLELDVEVPEEVYAGREVPLRLKAANRKGLLPSFLLQIEVNGGKVLLPYLDPNSEACLSVKVVFPKRGRHEIGPVSISSVFPFNFFRRRVLSGKKKEVVVFPSPKPFPIPNSLDRERPAGELYSKDRGVEGDLISIRDYVEKDPLKYVHWKQSARTEVLKIKELSDTEGRSRRIEFERIPARDAEERLSFATYLVLTLMRRRVPVGLKIKNVLFQPGLSEAHRRSLLKELALYEECMVP